MRGSDSDNPKNNPITFRPDDETEEIIDQLQEDWGVDSRSEVIRLNMKITVGLLTAPTFGLVDPVKLSEEWGDVGTLIANAMMSDDGLPEDLQDARLIDVLLNAGILAHAADAQVGSIDADSYLEDGG